MGIKKQMELRILLNVILCSMYNEVSLFYKPPPSSSRRLALVAIASSIVAAQHAPLQRNARHEMGCPIWISLSLLVMLD